MPYYWQNAMLLNAEHFRDTMHGAYMAECRISFAKTSHPTQSQRASAIGLSFHSVPIRSCGPPCCPVFCRQSKPSQMRPKTWNWQFKPYSPCALCACLCQRCDISPLTDEAVSSAVARRLPVFWPQVIWFCNAAKILRPPWCHRACFELK